MGCKCGAWCHGERIAGVLQLVGCASGDVMAWVEHVLPYLAGSAGRPALVVGVGCKGLLMTLHAPKWYCLVADVRHRRGVLLVDIL
jgi:hypothetical protein